MTDIAARKWHEFVHAPDLRRMLAWLADGEEGSMCSFRALNPGTREWVRVWLVKFHYDDHWLCVGDRVDHVDPPENFRKSGPAHSADHC